jgi:hypothetical protein
MIVERPLSVSLSAVCCVSALSVSPSGPSS